MALDHVDATHQSPPFVAAHLDDLAGAALVATGEDDDCVTLFDLGRHHSTSGAREMIFIWFLARSSRGTGPKMRVPTGSICGLISTAALRSKRMIEPSARLMSLEMRTMTAFITSPFFTRPRGIASFTETTITSPMVAYLRLLPPSTLMHMTRRAPELSATSRLDCIWIMGYPLNSSLSRALGSFLLAAHDRPALKLGNRPVLFDPHQVADLEFILLIVRVVLLRTAHRLLEQRMGVAAFDTHHQSLGLLVAHNDTVQHTLRHLFPLSLLRRRAFAARWS